MNDFQALKKSVINNQFLDNLRMSFVIDQEEFDSLLSAFKLIVEQWKNADEVDKYLVGYLFTAYIVISNQSERNEYGTEGTKNLNLMANELELLILEGLPA